MDEHERERNRHETCYCPKIHNARGSGNYSWNCGGNWTSSAHLSSYGDEGYYTGPARAMVSNAPAAKPMRTAYYSKPASQVMLADAAHMWGGWGALIWAGGCCGESTTAARNHHKSRHGNGENWGFIDGHVEWRNSMQMYRNKSTDLYITRNNH